MRVRNVSGVFFWGGDERQLVSGRGFGEGFKALNDW